ncbi:unnamed protein product [Effrenium voratum]|nr:unnamed protein product [Effrenium voratum]
MWLGRAPDDDTIVDAAFRGIREELHVDVSLSTEGLVHSALEDISYVEEMDSASYPGIPAIYATTHVRFNVQTGSMAETAFCHCGLPACRPFETLEWKLEGPLRLSWEWIEYHDALRSGIKGMQPPENIVLTKCGKNSPYGRTDPGRTK